MLIVQKLNPSNLEFQVEQNGIGCKAKGIFGINLCGLEIIVYFNWFTGGAFWVKALYEDFLRVQIVVLNPNSFHPFHHTTYLHPPYQKRIKSSHTSIKCEAARARARVLLHLLNLFYYFQKIQDEQSPNNL